MDEDRWDPLRDVLPSPEADILGMNDQTPAPAVNPEARGEGAPASEDGAGATVSGASDGAAENRDEGAELPHSPETLSLVEPGVENLEAREVGGMMGGATLPNNAQELAEDEVDESSMESFPASDPPAW